MEEFLGKLNEYGITAALGLNILKAAAILIIGWIVVKILAAVVRRILLRNRTDDTLTKFLVSLTKIVLLAFVVIAAIDALGVHTTSFVAIIGAAGLAIGFALQGSLANFAAGVMLMVFRPFKSGDYVEAGGTNGVIEAVEIFNTILNTPDNKRVIVPNGKITSDKIINYSAMEKRRVDLAFGIGYGDDIKKAKATLERILSEDERILEDPAPTVAVLELGDSSVNLVVRPWVKTLDYWNVYFAITEKVKLTFDQEGISIPFPQHDVHLFQAKAS